jgi:hypothetical protein
VCLSISWEWSDKCIQMHSEHLALRLSACKTYHFPYTVAQEMSLTGPPAKTRAPAAESLPLPHTPNPQVRTLKLWLSPSTRFWIPIVGQGQGTRFRLGRQPCSFSPVKNHTSYTSSFRPVVYHLWRREGTDYRLRKRYLQGSSLPASRRLVSRFHDVILHERLFDLSKSATVRWTIGPSLKFGMEFFSCGLLHGSFPLTWMR